MGAFTRSMQARSLSDSRSTDAGIALPELGCPVDALTRSMDVLSLGDLPSSTSTLKPLTWLRSATLDTSSSHLPQLPCFDSLSLKTTARNLTVLAFFAEPYDLGPPTAQVIQGRLRVNTPMHNISPTSGPLRPIWTTASFCPPTTRPPHCPEKSKATTQSTHTQCCASSMPEGPLRPNLDDTTRPSLSPTRRHSMATATVTLIYQSKSLLASFSTTFLICISLN
ncbi:hypothetical protein EDB19DRAFT_631383 [Suillus lakei]|nr:hypothetical protein EDB19DRAFT_631383 [Suillus lakei]